jgi:hypothetical protein
MTDPLFQSPFSRECPQRPYECLISTIKKLPWYQSGHITIAQRFAVYDATMKLIELLQKAMAKDPQHTTLNKQLLKRLVTAAMLCPGFTVVQKDNIAVLGGIDDQEQLKFNQPRFADCWVHLLALCPKPGVPLDVLEAGSFPSHLTLSSCSPEDIHPNIQATAVVHLGHSRGDDSPCQQPPGRRATRDSGQWPAH